MPERSDSGHQDTSDGSARTRGIRHDEAVMAAEVRALRRAIAPYGVLDGKTLHEVAHAESWQAGAFSTALGAAVDTGVLTRLPFGFYADSETLRDDPSQSGGPGEVGPG